jgi:hypothetical protein
LRILSIKLGSDPESRGVIQHLRKLIPEVWIAGVEERLDSPESVFDHVVTSHYDAYLGNYAGVNVAELAMTPELYSLVAPFEGQALSMLDRVRFYVPENYPPPRKGLPHFRDSFDARADLFSRHCRFWNYILDEHGIEAVIAQNFGHQGFDFVALSLAEAKGIPTLIFNETGQFPRVQFIQENVRQLGMLALGQELKKRVALEMTAEDPAFIRRTINSIQQTPDRFGNPDNYATSLLKSWLMDLNVRVARPSLQVLSTTLLNKFRRFQAQPIKRLVGMIKTQSRIRLTRNSMAEERSFSQVPNLDAKYVYFPLHFQPEATTSVKGRHFYQLREAVSFIASHLPPGWNLIVKEHPHQWRRLYNRKPGFYAELCEIPKVQLVHHSCNNFPLIQHAQAVVCVSHSSISAYATANGIPVISLGHSHFRESPNYYCIVSTTDLRDVIRNITIGSRSLGAQDQEQFLDKLERSTFEGLLGYTPKNIDSNEYRRILHVTQINISLVIREWLRLRGVLK